jgi:hypothetical protein
VNAGLLRCEIDARGNCTQVHACIDAPASDDCLAETEERAWSSPIFLERGAGPEGIEVSSADAAMR